MRIYEITEAWSKKYKDSINCSNPKGFSQKAHCAGKKKKTETKEAPKGTYFTKTGNLVKGRLTKAAKERGARETDPKDKSRSKVPPVTQTRESDYDFGGPRIDKDNTWRKFLRYKYKFRSAGSSIADMERIIRKKSPKEFNDLMNLKDRFYAGDQDLKTEGKRIPRKKGQPAGSKKHSDLYTDENPKGTIHGLKFATVKDAKASVSKIRNSGKKHAHKIQAAVAMEQRAKAAGKKSAAAVYRTFINKMKEKTKKMNENYGKYYCSTDKKWKYRKGPKQSRKKVSEYGVPDYNTMPTYKLKKASKGKQKFFLPSNEPTPKGVEAIDENIFKVGALAAMLGMSASALAQKDIISNFNDKVESTIQYYEKNPNSADRNKLENEQLSAAIGYLGNSNAYTSEINMSEDDKELLYNLRKLFFNTEYYKDEELMDKQPDWNLTLERRKAENSAKKVYLAVKKKEAESEEVKEDVVGMNPHAVKPYFSPDEADRAYDEWVNQAQVDQGDGVIIKGTDGKQYRILTSYGNQHFEDGEVYLDGLTDPEYLDKEGYPDAAELLYYHSATGHYPDDEKKVEENFADGKKKGKSRPGRVKRSGASCKGSVTSLRAKAKKYSGERGKMYHWCANMKGGKKKKKTNEGIFDELPLPTWMSHTSLEKMFRQEYGERYGDYLAYMDLDSDDDLAMSSDFGKMALDVAKEHDIKEMNKFLSQTPVQFKVDDLRLDQGVQVWHLVQQPTTIH